jgi:hypothetical protein
MIRSWSFVVLGLVLAASAAGALVGLEFAAFGWIAGVVEGSRSEGVVAYGLLAAIIAAAAFLVGLVFPGVPIWLWLHGIGQRSYWAAALATAIGASAAGVMLTASSAGWLSLVMIAWLLLPGAVAGLVLRAVAYARPKPPLPSPARPS